MSDRISVPAISQVAYVVPDLDEALRGYHHAYGWGPWKVFRYEPPDLRDLRMHGRPAECAWLCAETLVGATNFEVLQPLGSEGVFAEWLADHGSGVHHLAYCAATLDEADETHRKLEAAGAEELLSAWMNDVFFFYMQTPAGIMEVWTGDEDSVHAVRTYP